MKRPKEMKLVCERCGTSIKAKWSSIIRRYDVEEGWCHVALSPAPIFVGKTFYLCRECYKKLATWLRESRDEAITPSTTD